jgi:histidinol dehydrogenase
MYFIINPSRTEDIFSRPEKQREELEKIVDSIFNAVKLEGDKALQKYTQQFDQVLLKDLLVSEEEFSRAEKLVSGELKQAVQLAKSNIEKFHLAQKAEKKVTETTGGVECWQESRGIEKVGIYIPGGTAPLFSTVLMLAVPANIAGCREIILCSPPDKEGRIHPAILYAARITGVTKVYKAGGIQAIAAMTFGTESIPKVYKIFGPGNQYVTAAKRMAQNYGLAIDLPAGPSELLIVADETSVPRFVAADLLSQAEHGPDSQVVCMVNNKELFTGIEKEMNLQLEHLPRKETALQALKNSKFVCINDKVKTVEAVNEYAPEHLILATKDYEYYIENIVNAGSVFIGNYAPESAGDYASGTNHTLPTNGFAKAYSGVNLDSFTKKITFQKISEKGLMNIGKAIEIMAEAEQLDAHKNAVTVRLEKISAKP